METQTYGLQFQNVNGEYQLLQGPGLQGSRGIVDPTPACLAFVYRYTSQGNPVVKCILDQRRIHQMMGMLEDSLFKVDLIN